MTTNRNANEAHGRPAYIADAHWGDTITYMVQRLDVSGERPVVIDSYVTTVVRGEPTRSHNGNTPVINWIDADGATHRDAPNFHITIHN